MFVSGIFQYIFLNVQKFNSTASLKVRFSEVPEIM